MESNFSFRKYQHVNLAQFSERIIILVTHCVLQTTWNTMQYKIIQHSGTNMVEEETICVQNYVNYTMTSLFTPQIFETIVT